MISKFGLCHVKRNRARGAAHEKREGTKSLSKTGSVVTVQELKQNNFVHINDRTF